MKFVVAREGEAKKLGEDLGNIALGYFCLVVVCVVVAFVIVPVGAWLFTNLPVGDTLYRVGLSHKYQVETNHITIEERPTACDWSRSPLGDKGCHFDKYELVQKDAQGKAESVLVTWERKEQ